jgi:hypothetical protein
MDTQATQDSPPTPPRVTDRQPIRDTPPIPILQATDTRAARRTLPTQVRIMDIPLAISVVALRRTGRLGPSTRSSLLAEFQPAASRLVD